MQGAIFPSLLQTNTYFYTGKTREESPSKSTAQKFEEYDEYGNVTKFIDFGDGGSSCARQEFMIPKSEKIG